MTENESQTESESQTDRATAADDLRLPAQPSAVPLPPPDAVQHTTCCEYCPVACGYKVYTWPIDRRGGPAAAQNALGVDFPAPALSGHWPSENMHSVVRVDGELQNCLVMPDGDSEVVNVGGTHSVRGGALAKKLYTDNGPTSDRYLRPLLKVDGQHVPISWEAATDLVAALSTYTLDQHGPLAWGMKIYSYQYYENVFAGSKLALGAIGTANYSPHHAPADGDDVPGLSDCGIDAFSAAFADDKAADVLFIAGSDPYETKTVRFTTWQAPSGAPIIYVDPRKTFTANYAEQNGGMHLQLKPGTDTCLYNAIAREIIEQGWHNQSFIEAHTASAAELRSESGWRRQRFGRSFDQYRDELLSRDEFSLAGAERITGVPADKISEAARMLSGGDGEQPKTMILFEKGLYWSHNYENTASIGSLGVLLGSTGGEGRAISRMGGHQRGGQKGAGYPIDLSPHEFEGQKIEMDTERWFAEGNTRFRWIVGTNWLGAMGGTSALRRVVEDLTTRGPAVDSTDPTRALAQLKARIDAGGTVMVHQEIYPNESTQYADLILPAATWGEETFARNNAERRLRIYERFVDPPGETRPDWQIFAEVGRKMGFDGFDWEDSNAIFEEAAERSSGGRRDFQALVEKAKADGRTGHDLLRDFGTKGLQTPLKLENGQLVETVRLHTDMNFKSDSGKANFVFSDWDAVAARNTTLGPDERAGEMWILNGRVNALWNNMFDHARRVLSTERWPANFLEINAEDAAERDIVSGDMLSIESSNVLDQLGNKHRGGFTAVAYVTDTVQPGVTYTYFLYPGSPANTVTSADSSLQPISLRYNFKLGRGTVTKIGTTDLARTMSFAPRNLAPTI